MLIDHIAIGVDLCSLNIPDFSVGKDGEGMFTVTAYSINTETDMKTDKGRIVNQIQRLNLRWTNNGSADRND